ncbi:non-hydrolyzing UDP-N-acetylglucosamine 2-epimerase [Methylolobus aquaticus]
MKIAILLGTRPEVIKNYPVVKGLKELGMDFLVLHTNQHADYAMQGAAFDEMGYAPDHILPEEYTIGRAIDWVRELIREKAVDLLLVNGDTAASLVGTVAALYSDRPLAHVEAGLRSYDKAMYEERNRIICDSTANFMFTNTEAQKRYLENNHELRGKVFHSGNTSIDIIEDFSEGLERPVPDRYAYVTLHRKEFTDHRALMVSVFETLAWLARNRFSRIVFPMHPRTRHAMKEHAIPYSVLGEVEIIDPVPPLASLAFEKYAEIILTDSGCIQEEAYILRVPCVTIRENSERMETVESGANIISGFRHEDIVAAAVKHCEGKEHAFPPIYGEYGVGLRIAEILHNAREGLQAASGRLGR